MNRQFHIGDVLSIVTGILVSPRLMDGVYDILNYMTGDNLFTHQLPRASHEVLPYILAQHPTLADCDANGVNKDNLDEWLAEQAKRYGLMLSLSSIPTGEYKHLNPLTELSRMVDPEKIIVVDTSHE